MYDYNVFAVLTAVDDGNNARSAFNLPQNARWLRKAIEDIAEVFIIDSREPTPTTDSSVKQKINAADRLVLTFDELLKNLSNEVQLNTNSRSSHVLLEHWETPNVNARQYNIVVDDELRIWLRDYSKHKTAVNYADQNETKFRKRKMWILCLQPDNRNVFEDMKIHSKQLSIQVMFSNHETMNSRYVKNLRKIFKKNNETIPPVDGFELDSNSTTATSSQAQTLRESFIYFEKTRIESDAFDEVVRVIRTHDAKYFVIKKFSPLVNKRKRDEHDFTWLKIIRREFFIMKDNSHVNVS